MDAIISVETGAVSQAELNAVAVDRIIARAKDLAKDRTLDKWTCVYEPAKWAISKFTSSSDEYEAAIKRLSEAVGI